MSGIAKLLLDNGFKVSGSDLKEGRATKELQDMGAQVHIGHRGANIKGANIVIYSSAISQDNPEMEAAKKTGLTLLKRAQALAGLMQQKKVITVTGSHGKITTPSLAAHLLFEAGLSPAAAIGGILINIDNNASFGKGEYFVAEADESDGSFLYYRPNYSIVTNIDYEHLDYYKDFHNELKAFKEFIENTQGDGCVFACADDQNLMALLKDYKRKKVLFGLKNDADIWPKNIKIEGLSSQFDCFYKNKFVDRFSLFLGGLHNISNALSVIALGLELGIAIEPIKKALKNFKGARRRLEIKFKGQDVLVIDDYAHHPSEIKATLLALKELRRKRIVAVFQPHRYTRTKLLLDEFGRCFNAADYVIITDIYPASEPAIEGISGNSVYQKIKEYSPGKEAVYLPKAKITTHLLKAIEPFDLVVILGAGDIVNISNELVEGLKRKVEA